MNKNTDIITLCSVCLKDFKNTNISKIRRTKNKTRDSCTYCGFRMGFDYEIEPKKGGK